jgi:RNA ligase
LATQRSFSSLKAQRATSILYKKYSHLFPQLKRDRTYIFEAIYPEASVLIDYGDKEDLVLIGVLDNETGHSMELEDIGFPVVEEFTDKLSNIANFSELEALNMGNKEGFVVLFEDQQRVKIKFPWYQNVHINLDKMVFEWRYIVELNKFNKFIYFF